MAEFAFKPLAVLLTMRSKRPLTFLAGPNSPTSPYRHQLSNTLIPRRLQKVVTIASGLCLSADRHKFSDVLHVSSLRRSVFRSSIPKGLRPPAQGCEERATL